jgi:Nif-specific regulatory protein
MTNTSAKLPFETNLPETGLALIQREFTVVQLLFDISQALNKSLKLEEVLDSALKIMSEHAGMKRGTIMLLSGETGEFEIDIAHGSPMEEKTRGKLKGIIKRVIEKGVPAIVEKVSQEPQFLDDEHVRSRFVRRSRDENSFLCVPIQSGNGIIGVIAVDRLFPEASSIENDARLLATIASLLAQVVELRWEARDRERALEEENLRLQSEILDHFNPGNIIGNSHAIKKVYQLINQVAQSNARVLITGESGVGKELAAEAIHINSSRAAKPFVKINCAAVPESLIESELFGHERGAIAMRKGRLEMADGGTLFLDEITDLPMSAQIRLLRVLQENEFERIGGVQTIKVDVRIISATNRNIEELIKNFQFRLDLYYRLNLFPIYIPPLRERKIDIVPLAEHFIEHFSIKHGKSITQISADAINMMMNYHWPGNVRELKSSIERAIMNSDDGILHAFHMPLSLQTADEGKTPSQRNLPAAITALEHEMIVNALRSSHGNASHAARALGVSDRFMRLRIAKHKIDAEWFK